MTNGFDLMEHNVKKHGEAFERLRGSDELKRAVVLAADRIRASFEAGGKLILCGNGGSAADCQHIAAEFVGRFKLERPALPAIALNCNTSSVTAIGNDYSFERAFARQVEAFAGANDVLIGISTSGGSKSVVRALETAKELGCFTILLTGNGCKASTADLTIKAPSDNTPTIQEMHIFIGHFLAEYVEETMNENRNLQA